MASVYGLSPVGNKYSAGLPAEGGRTPAERGLGNRQGLQAALASSSANSSAMKSTKARARKLQPLRHHRVDVGLGRPAGPAAHVPLGAHHDAQAFERPGHARSRHRWWPGCRGPSRSGCGGAPCRWKGAACRRPRRPGGCRCSCGAPDRRRAGLPWRAGRGRTAGAGSAPGGARSRGHRAARRSGCRRRRRRRCAAAGSPTAATAPPPRMALHEARDHRRHMAAAEAQRGVDPQQPARRRRDAPADWPSSSISPRMRRAPRRPLALGRQAHAPRGAVDQRHAGALTRSAPAACSPRPWTGQLARRAAQAGAARQRDQEAQFAGLDDGFMPVAIVHLRLTMDSLAPICVTSSGLPTVQPRSTAHQAPHEDLPHRDHSRRRHRQGGRARRPQGAAGARAADRAASPSSSRISAGAATGTARTAR